MHTFLNMIHNFGNGLHFIGLEADKLYKFASKKVREVINMILQNSTGDDLIDYKVYGNSKQDTTTGKNKANPNEFVKGRLDNGVIGYASGTSSIEYSEPTLTVETNTLYRGFVSNLIELATSNFFISFSSSTNAVCKIAYYDNDSNFISQAEYNSLDNVNGKKLTKPANAKYFRFSIEYQTVGTFTLSNIQVEENSSSATSYEPYTGGIASPNPDYPQEIQSVGDRTKNIFDGEWESGSITIETGNNVANPNNIRTKNYIPIKPNTQYAISGASKSRYGVYYDANKNYLGYVLVTLQASFGTFTSIANASHIRWYQVNNTDTTSKEQLEENATATSYEPYGYKIPVKISGKNKVHLTDVVKTTIANGTYEVENQIATLDGGIWAGASIAFVGSATSGDFPTIFTLKKGKTYNIKMFNLGGTATTLGHNIALRGKTGNLNIGTKTITNMIEGFNYTPTQDEECVGIFAYFTAATFDNFKFQIQIKEATITDNTFEPYHEPINKNIYLDRPLYKSGDVADYIKFSSGKRYNLFKDGVIENIISIYSDGGAFKYLMFSKNQDQKLYGEWGTAHMLGNYAGNSFFNSPYKYDSGNNKTQNDIRIPSSDTRTLEEFRTLLNGTSYIYELATPTEETIDLPEIPTFEGTTIIEVDTEVQPSNMWVQYYAKE